MSTRKMSSATTTTAVTASTTPQVAVSPVKAENVSPKGTTTNISTEKTTIIASISGETAEMGTNISSTCHNSDLEMSEAVETVNINTPTSTSTTAAISKESPKADSKRASSEPRRITRNSPLLLASPTLSRKEFRNSEAGDPELTNSESDDGSATRRSLQIKGRKSLKECRDTIKKPAQNQQIKDNNEALDTNTSDSVTKEVKETGNETKENDKKKSPGAATENDSEHNAGDMDDLTSTTSATSIAITTAPINACPASAPSAPTVSTSNRLTRKSVTQELVANTRVTRNRRPETPPIATMSASTRPRRSTAGKKTATSMSEPAGKRKRTADEDSCTISGSTESLSGKYIKMEPKDDCEAADDGLPPPNQIATTSASDIEALKIKSEPIESDESATDGSTSGSNITRSRSSRWSVRKPQQANLQSSPTTRATRQTKNSSPSPSSTTSSASNASGSTITEMTKRRRMNTITRNSTATSSPTVTLLKTVTAAGGGVGANSSATSVHVPDEDSKDSMASSSIDELMLADIKMEKLAADLADEVHHVAYIEGEEKSSTDSACSKTITVPLTIYTDTVVMNEPKDQGASENNADKMNLEDTVAAQRDISLPALSSSTAATIDGAGKAASLSPEMVSEGVSEISVKQFYKKPKFLENNLGIEEDPKLGEIVQKVNTENVKEKTTVDDVEHKDNYPISSADIDSALISPIGKLPANDESDAVSIESDDIKEGQLRIDDSKEEKVKANDDDAHSMSAEVLSPLMIGEDDEIDETAAMDGDGNVTEQSKNIETQTKKDANEFRSTNDIYGADDDVTMEESESISMDNNPSIQEDVMDDEQIDGVDIENEVYERQIENKIRVENVDGNKREANIKTKTVCDSIKAKLKFENELNENKINDDEENEKSNVVHDDKETEKSESLVEKIDMGETITKYSKDNPPTEIKVFDGPEHVEINTNEMQSEGEEEEDDTKLCIDMAEEEVSATENMETIENIEDDEVVAKIDAELKKYDDMEKCKMHDQDDNTAKFVDENKHGAKPIETTENDDIANCSAEMNNAKNEKASVTEPLMPDSVETHENKLSDNSDATDKRDIPISTTNSPAKSFIVKEDDSTSMKSCQSTDSNSWITLELENDEEILRQKEQHFQNLGLLTHKAAEKRRQEYIQSSAAAEATRAQNVSKRNGKSSTSAVAHEYTGTLKTVIKINRHTSGGSHTSAAGVGNVRKSNSNCSQHSGIAYGAGSSTSRDATNGGNTARRQSLKMTFQKGRGRGQGHADRSADQHSNVEDAYYTIQNENEGGLKSGSNAGSTAEYSNVQTHGRKSYNRSNTTSHSSNTAIIDSSHSEGYDATHHHHTINSTSSHKKDEKEEILIPEKASSFKFHPGRLCDDQCFYCSGKFGLYDTPCHVGQIKSAERQQKILANEEKLTVDSCLCDACFRHVDRRANVPSYKKRMSATNQVDAGCTSASTESHDNNTMDVEDDLSSHKCLVPDCANPAAHSLRRKCIRKSVKKFLLNFDMPTGAACVWLCQAHYDTVIQCSGCVLCKRRLGKNHMYHITSDTDRLEKALSDMGIPVQLGIGTAVCKLCRYFANLLMKPPDSTKSQKAEFVKNYRKRLLQFHNIHDGSNDVSEADDEEGNNGNMNNKESCSKKTPQKINQTCSTEVVEVKPLKSLSSPTDSNGSSIECLGEAATLTISANESRDGTNTQQSQKKQQKSKSSLLAKDVLVDFDRATALTTDSSNSSSAPMSPRNGNTNTNTSGASSKQMSKLQAILQSSSSGLQKTTQKSSSLSSSSSTTSSAAGADSANDISNVLRANPNISMRELFPGEEDLGLHFKVPFGSSSSQRTPEGWTRVQTFLQYDEATRRLWEDLQKPYGNQSSFLRHLILLEKYYRNGDLVLSPNASSNASVYTQTVRQRLTSYDQGHFGGLLSAKPSPTSSKRSSTDIPTVEINEDDEEMKRTKSNESCTQRMDVDDFAFAADMSNASRLKRGRSDSVDKLTKQLSSNAVTIIARPKAQVAGDPSPQKSLLKEKSIDNSMVASTTLTVVGANNSSACGNNGNSSSSNTSNNSRSILKTNLLGMNKAVEIVPISASNNASNVNISGGNNKSQSASNTGGNSTANTESKHQKILELANKLLDNRIEAAAAAAAEQTKNSSGGSGACLLTSPPELVSLQRRPTATAISTGSASTSSTPAPPTTTSTVSSLTASLINNKRIPGATKAAGGGGNSSSGGGGGGGGGNANAEGTPTSQRAPPPNVVILPDTLTLRERQQRSWRPTLMAVEENLHLVDKGGPLYQTADGRRLPALVQVLSGGKPFLISIFDYNRMCILRREKLLRDQMLKTRKTQHDGKQQQQQHGSKTAAAHGHATNLNKHAIKHTQQQPQQQHHQTQQQQQVAQQQLMHLQMMQMQKQAALKAPNRFAPIAPKAATTTTATAHKNSGGGGGGGIICNIPSTSYTPVANSNSSVFSSPMMPLLTSAFATPNQNPLAVAAAAAAATAKLNNNAWLWNFPDPNQLLNGSNMAPQSAPKLPQLLHKGQPVGGGSNSGVNIAATITSKQQQQQQQQTLIDNALMSKIPKTLTVIPQHKLMGNNSNPTASMSHKE